MKTSKQLTALYARLPVNQALAIERTVLANERTVLAYGRTALAIIIAGVSGAEFLPGHVFWVLGYLVAAIGVALLAWGVHRYRASNRKVLAIFDVIEKGQPPGG